MQGPEAPEQAIRDTQLLAAASEAAGEIALRFWRRSPDAWEKPGDAGPVSEADLAVDRALQAELSAARPDYGWLSEESPDDGARLGHDSVFIIDPIDGTRAFLAGEEAFAVSLAVAVAGKITAAAVHLPARGLTYAASIGGIARCNGVQIHASRRQELTGAEVMTNKANFSAENWPGGVPDVKRSFRSSLAWRLCLAAEGQADAMLSLRPTWEWDSAAGSLIAERAGCLVADRLGAALAFNQAVPQSNGVVAAPPALYRGLMAALGQPVTG